MENVAIFHSLNGQKTSMVEILERCIMNLAKRWPFQSTTLLWNKNKIFASGPCQEAVMGKDPDSTFLISSF